MKASPSVVEAINRNLRVSIITVFGWKSFHFVRPSNLAGPGTPPLYNDRSLYIQKKDLDEQLAACYYHY